MLKALLAEDDDIFARYVQRCVDWETIKTELAGRARTGDEALELAEKLRPDIIIMDVELPGPSGLDCIARLRESRQSCEILLVTGHDEFEYAQSGAKYGVTDILLKPMPRRALELALENAVNEHWAKRISAAAMSGYMGSGEPTALELLEEGAAEQSVLGLASAIVKRVRENDVYHINEDITQYLLAVDRRPAPYNHIFWLDAFPALLCFELLRGDLAEEAPSPLNDRQKLLETVQGAVLSETINQTLFELCSRTAAALANRPQPNSTHVTDKAYYNIQKYYPDPKFNVSTLAEMMHFHEGYLRRIFKASFGKSPAAVLKETRMAAAKKLLEEGDMQIQQVARSVGFEDASYFSKCFKQYYGYSPSDIK